MATVTTILGLTALTTVLSDDVVPVVDVHDPSQSPSGSTKKITVANLFAPYAPLSGATFTGGVSGTTLNLSGTLSLVNFQLSGNQINAVQSNANDAINFNYVGYAGGTTQFRDLVIYDGKNGTVATFTGSTKAAQLAGALTFSVDNTADIGAVGANRPRNVYVAGTVTAGSAVIGPTTLNSTLSVTGATTLGTLSVGAISLGGTVTPGAAWNLGASGSRFGTVFTQIVDVSSTLTVTGAASFGSTTAAAGQIRMPSQSGINFRNAANSADIVGLYTDASDHVIVGSNASVILQSSTGNNLGFYGSSGAAKTTLTGSKGGNVALGNLVSLLASMGLFTDSTT